MRIDLLRHVGEKDQYYRERIMQLPQYQRLERCPPNFWEEQITNPVGYCILTCMARKLCPKELTQEMEHTLYLQR